MIPPDDLLQRLYRALVRVDADRDTFHDAFLWMYSHPCADEEWEHRFVTRFYFLRKDRWSAASRYVPIGSVPVLPAACESPGDSGNDGDIGEREERFINTLRDAILKETHKNRQPEKSGRRRP